MTDECFRLHYPREVRDMTKECTNGWFQRLIDRNLMMTSYIISINLWSIRYALLIELESDPLALLYILSKVCFTHTLSSDHLSARCMGERGEHRGKRLRWTWSLAG